MGQWLFVEKMAGLPLLDAFSEFLLQGRVDFSWEPTTAAIRYADIEPSVARSVAEAQRLHARPPDHSSSDDDVVAAAAV